MDQADQTILGEDRHLALPIKVGRVGALNQAAVPVFEG
jgi:hypothetical protein